MDRRCFRIAHIDDEVFYQKLVREMLPIDTFEVASFGHPDDFLSSLIEKIDIFDMLITDFFFRGCDLESGDIVNNCKYYGLNGPIVLYSNTTMGVDMSQFQLVVNKGYLLESDQLGKLMRTHHVI